MNSSRARTKAGKRDKIAVSKELINDCVRYAPAPDLLYLNNPKCACTTVKHALWFASDTFSGQSTFAGNVHDRTVDPFAKNVFWLPPRQREKVAQAVVFSVVRNPFARILSAYTDKVANDPAVWPVFLNRFGLKPTVGKSELSFADFIGLVSVAHDDLLDGHFRPQYVNLLLPLAKPVFIGFVEYMAPVGAFLERSGVRFRDERMNATSALEQLSVLYDTRSAALVRERYAADFATFGYSTDLSDVGACPITDGLWNDSSREDSLLCWLATGRAPPGFVAERRSPFSKFNRSQDRQEKMAFVSRCDFNAEHNWYRLERYLDFVIRKARDRQLAEAIRDRMASLRHRYKEVVSNPDIFVPFA